MERKAAIPYYEDINEFLASIPVSGRTADPLFYCLKMDENEGDLSKPPFRRGFYFVALLSNAKETRISYDNTDAANLDSVLVFQSPGLLYSFYRARTTHGYFIYFKPESLSFFKPPLEQEFPFFNVQHTNVFHINEAKLKELTPLFDDICSSYENAPDPSHRIAGLKLLATLYQLKEALSLSEWPDRYASPQQVLSDKFWRLLNNYYIDKRTVEEYAALLCVSANHLSRSVKSVTGKNALSHINERLLAEAKSLIQYTAIDIAEIAYKLNFSDPANFGKFFKRLTGATPLEFRKQREAGN